jgi:tripartite ATP-independent transporter DctM subunit
MLRTGIALNMINAVDKWLVRLPGRLGVVAVISGAIMAALTGNSMTSVALLGESLLPEMRKKGYSDEIAMGPIMGSGGLAVLIPPSDLCVLIASVGMISVGNALIGIIVPGLLATIILAVYIVIRCVMQPELAPRGEVEKISFRAKMKDTLKYIVPLAFVIFCVIGVMLLGIATPTEASATGAVATAILGLCYRTLSWDVIKDSLKHTLQISVMIFMIIGCAAVFAQMVAFSGASTQLVKWATTLSMAPILVVAGMVIIALLLGCFMPSSAHVMIAIPLFLPVVAALGYDKVWFVVMYLVATEIGFITPPYGCNLFVMKMLQPNVNMGAIIKAVVPFIWMHCLVVLLILLFPSLVLWLPSLVK